MFPTIAVVFAAGHGMIFFYVSTHTALSAAVLSAVVVIVAIKHLGFLGAICGVLWRRFRA
jgi:hypothetical protein